MNETLHRSRWRRAEQELPVEGALRIDGFLPWFFLHLLVGVMVSRSEMLATIHALATVAMGVLFALDTKRPWRVAAVGAYIVGADVLWRMTHADVLHQFGKYAATGIFVLWMLRAGSFKRVLGPALYLACLVPSIWIAVESRDLAFVIRRLSFNLSGPLALGVGILFFRQITLTRRQLTYILAWAASSVFAVYAVALVSTMSASEIHFSTESNYITSGGFGPNQVSATLGFGTVCLFWLLTLTRSRGLAGGITWAGLMALGVQSALTFSRGGLYTAVGAILIALPFLLGHARVARRVLAGGIVLLIVTQVVLLPDLKNFTGGKITERFQQTKLTSRREIMRRDIGLWEHHPLFGVGPGMSASTYFAGGRHALAHTEYTRLAAEHGIFGLIAIALVAGMAVGAVSQARAGPQRAFVISCAAWALLYMCHVAMRQEAPAFLLGLAGVAFSTRWDMSDATDEECEDVAVPHGWKHA